MAFSLSRILLVDSLNLRIQQAHLGLGHVALISKGKEYELDEYSEDEDYNSIITKYRTEDIEYRNYNQCINPPYDRPSQRNQFRKVKIIVGIKFLVDSAQHRIEVGADKNIERSRTLCAGVVVEGGYCLHLLEIVGIIVYRKYRRLQSRVVERIACDESHGEELVLNASHLTGSLISLESDDVSLRLSTPPPAYL